MTTIERYARKVGNSLAIILGKFICEEEGIKENDKIKIEILEVEHERKKKS